MSGEAFKKMFVEITNLRTFFGWLNGSMEKADGELAAFPSIGMARTRRLGWLFKLETMVLTRRGARSNVEDKAKMSRQPAADSRPEVFTKSPKPIRRLRFPACR